MDPPDPAITAMSQCDRATRCSCVANCQVSALSERSLSLCMLQPNRMTPDGARNSLRLRFAAAATSLALLTSCATQPTGSPQAVAAAASLREARSHALPAETRAADYLRAAALTAPDIRNGT